MIFQLVFLLIVGAFNTAYATEIKVHVDRSPVNLQESFQLIFTANASPDADPDFSPLNKDFEILNQSTQQSTKIVDWKTTKTIQWIVTVMAKHTGSLIIPAIHFGDDTSQFSTIAVNKAQLQKNTNKDLFLQVTVNTDTPYIQEQVIYTLKLFRKVNITGANLTEPVLDSAVIVRLDEDKNYEATHNGEQYAVVERNYAIFPQKSGNMRIESLRLTAGVLINNQRRNSFFNQQQSRQQRIHSQAIELKVKPQASGFKGKNWLVAEQVYIEEKWSAEPNNIPVGEPVTRTLSLFVQGATVGALPEIQAANLPLQIKSYPDQPVLKEAPKDGSLVAFREEKNALIPTEAGDFNLPEIRIPWWNARTQTQEVAIVPAKTISAVAAVITKPSIQAISKLPELVDNSVDKPQEQGIWFPLAIFFGSAWLVSLLYFLWNKYKPKQVAPIKPIVKQSAFSKKAFKQACQQHQPQQAKAMLLLWADKEISLDAIAKQCDPDLAEAIRALNTSLYANHTDNWQGDALWLAFQKNSKSKQEKQTSNDDALAPLFKI